MTHPQQDSQHQVSSRQRVKIGIPQVPVQNAGGRQEAAQQRHQGCPGKSLLLDAHGDSTPNQTQQQGRTAVGSSQEGQPATGQEHSVGLANLIQSQSGRGDQQGAEHDAQRRQRHPGEKLTEAAQQTEQNQQEARALAIKLAASPTAITQVARQHRQRQSAAQAGSQHIDAAKPQQAIASRGRVGVSLGLAQQHQVAHQCRDQNRQRHRQQLGAQPEKLQPLFDPAELPVGQERTLKVRNLKAGPGKNLGRHACAQHQPASRQTKRPG